MKEIKWQTFKLKHDRYKELSLDMTLPDVVRIKSLGIDGEAVVEAYFPSRSFYAKHVRKLNHKWLMNKYKVIGKYHIKIPKCSRSRIRGRGRK